MLAKVIFKVGQEWSTPSTKDASTESCIDHLYSCENNAIFQSWITQTQEPQILVNDIAEMENSVLTDVITGMAAARPIANAVFCGWVCHDTFLGCLGRMHSMQYERQYACIFEFWDMTI